MFLLGSTVEAITDLAANLDAQVELYSRMLELSQRQLAALRTRDVHGVHNTLQELELAMLERGRLEARRNELVATVARELHVAEDDVSVSLLQSRCAGLDIAGRIETASATLKGIVGELDRIVSANSALLEHEINAVDHMVKGLTVVRTATPKYLRNGSQAGPVRIKLLDAQV
jgi:hypothetical protein